MLKNLLTKDEMLKIMAEIEGHLDNVASAFLGGLALSYKSSEKVVARKCSVSKDLKFYAIIPSVSVSTKNARAILPDSYSALDVVHNLSRALNLSYAFESGDINLILGVFDDKLHQPYRLPLINGAEEVKKLLEENGFAVALSGAGPTLLAVGKNSLDLGVVPKVLGGVRWKVKQLKVCDGGAILR
jgi:homoserine kinase